MAMRKGITSREAEQRRFDEAQVASFFGVPESIMGIRPRSRIDDAVEAFGLGKAVEAAAVSALFGVAGPETFKRGWIGDHRVTHTGVDLGAGEVFETSAMYRRNAAGKLEIVSFAPVYRPHVLNRTEAAAQARARLRLELSGRDHMTPSILRLGDRVEVMRYRIQDNARPGAGRAALFWRIVTAYGARQLSFGIGWKAAADRYARLQGVHVELYGETVPVAALRSEIETFDLWREQLAQDEEGDDRPTFTPEDLA